MTTAANAQSPRDITVWRAEARHRWMSTAVIALLVLLSIMVLSRYGWYAAIGVTLVMSACAVTWWNLLRPKLTAGPDGVDVVTGWSPVHLAWREIRRCESGREGLMIFCADGRAVLSRFPQQRRAVNAATTEADLAASYLTERAAWARKPKGPAPTYSPPPPPVKTGRR